MGTQAVIEEALEIAIVLCKAFEGFSSTPYICPAGHPTIGYGTVFKPDGTKVTMQDKPITKEVATEWLVSELRNTYMAGVLRVSPHLIYHPKKLAALSDFAYNLGVPRYKASTLAKRVNKEDWEGAKVEINKWVFGSGKKLPGLVKRRAVEAKLL